LAKIEATLLKALRIDIDAALLSVGQKHGVTIRVGPAPVVPAPLFGNVPVSVPPIPAPKAPVAKKGFADSARIVTLTSTNPYKAGSKAANTFDLLASVGTVGKFKAAVAAAPGKYDPSYLTWCTAPHGNQPAYISIQ
jgi:hypothetical protein